MKFTSLFGLIGLFVFLQSCSSRNEVSITEHNLGDTIDVQQNLVFTFSHDLAPDSIFEKWDSTAYLLFTPEVKGSFKWTGKRTLVFSPSGGFRPACAYTAKPNPYLLRFADKRLHLADESFPFRTPDLALDGAQTWWSLAPGSAELTLNVSLQFNYEVEPADLQNRLTAFIKGRALPVKVESKDQASNLNVRLTGITASEVSGAALELHIEKGLLCRECALAAGIIKYSVELTPTDQLEVTALEQSFENGEGLIRILTNQPVSAAGLEKIISMSPALPVRYEALESGIAIRGAFASGSTYEVYLSTALQGVLGGRLNSDYAGSVTFGEQEPALAFTNTKGMYLSSKGSRKIGLQVINIPKIHVTVYKIFENNILSYLNDNRYEDWYDENSQGNWTYNDYNAGRYGNKVLDQDYETRNLPRQNGASLFSLDFDDALPFKGVYLITASSSENRWLRTSRIVSVSDIGLIARAGEEEVMVFANSISGASAMANVKVQVLSSNNQVLFSSVTNAEGVVKFNGLNSRYAEFKPALITASNGQDFNYMLLSDARVETSRFETGGYREVAGGTMAFLYGDREIYRPGETVHAQAIVRDRKWKAIPNMPVRFRLLLPNGRELFTQRSQLDSDGATGQDFVLPAGTVTGTYTLELYGSTDVLLSSRNLSIEEFMPDRISVKANTDKVNYSLGDSVMLDAKANNLFGTAASARNYEVQFNLQRIAFAPKGYDAWNFSINNADKMNFPALFRQGKTGQNGEIKEVLYLDPIYRETGKLQGKAFITVFDETGRPVNRVNNFEVETQQVYYGLRCSETYGGVGQPLQLGFVSLNGKGIPVSSSAEVRIIKVNYHNVLERSYGDRYHFKSQRQEQILQTKTIAINTREALLPFTPRESGEYLVRVSRPGSDRYIEQTFYAYGWGFTGSGAFAVNTEGTIDITCDRQIYKPGENARLLFKTPFNGRLLVTVEQHEVYKYYYLNTDKKSAELVIPVDGNYLPNVYITATLFRKNDESPIPLTVAHGVLPLTVEDESNRLPVEIKVAEKSRANTRQQITVKTTPGRSVSMTIAVVDEGILQLRNTESPDPYKWFYQKKALMTEAYDVYPYLLPEYRMRRSSTGGDGYSLAKRVNPITSKRVKLVSAWSGTLKANAAGIASYPVDIPSFSGDLRVMAVAWQGPRFGSAEAHIKVADPVVISSALPRFMSPGDTLDVPVTLSNTTDRPINAVLKAEGSGLLQCIGNNGGNIRIEPGREQRVVYKVTGKGGTGSGGFRMRVQNGNESYSDLTELSIRPAAGLQVRDGSGSLKNGSTASVDLLQGYVPSGIEAELIVSRSPMVAFSDHMQYLLDYPHGCAEQTISTAFPQLYYADLARMISNNRSGSVNISGNIQAAITKILGLQQYNGSIATWPGQSEGQDWTSVYAAHFLSECKKAGYSVQEKSLDKLMVYLKQTVKKKNKEELWYYDNANTLLKRSIASKTTFYALYVLALQHQADRSIMNYYKTRTAELSLDSRYLLAAAYLAIGDRKSYSELLPKSFSGEKARQEAGGSYYSYIRDLALALNALMENDPDHPQCADLVRQLSQALAKQDWLNTQERAFSFMALGKFSKAQAGSNITATISNGRGKSWNFTGKDLVLRKDVAGEKINISATGNGTLYYYWNCKGLSPDGSYVQEDRGMRIRKAFFDRNGKAITNGRFKQNDLVVIQLTVENAGNAMIENVVVSDMLPAGFEIENPRINAIPDLDWIKDASPSDHIDIRDDRLNIYANIPLKAQNYYYVVRAVSPGSYVMGPASADAMYSGEYHSMHGAGRITVTP
jgi:uncharacterized repeat protein (TIGR01451 family)